MRLFTSFLFLTLVGYNLFGQTDLISGNSNFYNGSSTNWSKSGNVNIVGSGFSNCYSCPGYAALGVDNSGYPIDNAYGTLSRTISIPSNVKNGSTATLYFYMYITTAETNNSVAYDILDLTLKMSNGAGYKINTPYSNKNYASGYSQYYVTFNNISDYAGQTMTLQWVVDNDNAKPTTFRIDDVSFMVELNASKPDLIIEQYPSLSNSAVQAGSSTTVYFKVINQGSVQASSSVTSIHISPYNYYNGSANWLSDYTTSSLNGNSNTGTLSKTLTIPSTTTPGNYYILVSADGAGYIDESNESNQTTYVQITITSPPQYGSLNVTLSPQDAIDKGAQWQIDGKGWRNSGNTEYNLSVGSHSIEFKPITGYATPPSRNISISANNTTTEYQSYSANTEPKIKTNFSTLDFTNVCASTTKDFTLTNTGTADLTVQPISNISNYSTDLNNAITLKPTESRQVFVNFSPSGTGIYNGALKVNSNASNQSQLIINLNGSCDLNNNLSITGSVNPQTGFVGDKFTWDANIAGNSGSNLTVVLEITNPVTNVAETFPMTKNSLTNFSFSMNLTAIGNYKYRFQINQTGTYSQSYGEPITYVQQPKDDYPRVSWFNENCDKSETYDPWGFEGNQCVSWVAWKVNQAFGVTALNLSRTKYPFYNTMNGGHFGNASNWKANAEVYTKKWPVNQTPAIGAIAWFGKGEAGSSSSGHVAYVHDYNNVDNKLTLTEYNFVTCEYTSRTVDLSKPNVSGNRTPSWFIHVEGGKGEGDTSSQSNKINLFSVENFKVYPNPSNGIFSVELFAYKPDLVDVKLIDLTGQEVNSVKWPLVSGLNSNDLNFDSTSNGIYILLIKASNVVIHKKVQIQN